MMTMTDTADHAHESLPRPSTMYEALCARDGSFEGVFFYGVRTTGIVCRPTCRARKPKACNVDYFPSLEQALLAGFRPCRVCRPVEPLDATPEWLRPLLVEVEASGEGHRWRDDELRARGFDPVRVRRWFVGRHGMTFHAFLRARRLGDALGRLQQKATGGVLEAGFEAGFESASGFRDAFRRLFGTPPGRARKAARRAFVDRLETPLGIVVGIATEDGLWMLEFADRRMLETQIGRVRKLLGDSTTFVPGRCDVLDETGRQLEKYFAGARPSFDLPMRLDGTEFQSRVWQQLLEIPSGGTRSYGQLAESIGRPRAIRAVGRANGDNRLAIVVPCHRVVGADGRLVGYGGRLWRKKWLLEHEQRAGAAGGSQAKNT